MSGGIGTGTSTTAIDWDDWGDDSPAPTPFIKNSSGRSRTTSSSSTCPTAPPPPPLPIYRGPKMNAYHFYCVRRRKELATFGINPSYGNLNIDHVFRREWAEMPEEDKSSFKKAEKDFKDLIIRTNNNPPIFADLPVGWSKSYEPKIEDMAMEITPSLYKKTGPLGEEERALPYNKYFLVVHFGFYCQSNEGLHPSEFCIAVFNVRDGIQEVYSRLLDPGPGVVADSKIKRDGYERPGFNPSMNFGTDCLDHLEFFMEKYQTVPEKPGFLFTYDGDLGAVWNCLEFIVRETGRQLRFKLLPLSVLLVTLMKEATLLHSLNNSEKVINVPSEKEAKILIHLENGKWEHSSHLACNYHKQGSKEVAIPLCSMNQAKRWIYNLLAPLTYAYDVVKFNFNHVPSYDLPTESFGFCAYEALSSTQNLPGFQEPDQAFPMGVCVYKPKEINNENGDLSNDILVTNEVFPDLNVIKYVRDKSYRAMEIERLPPWATRRVIRSGFIVHWTILGERKEKPSDVSIAHKSWKDLHLARKEGLSIDYSIIQTPKLHAAAGEEDLSSNCSNIPALKLRPFAQKEDLSSNVSNIPALKLRPVAQKEDLSSNVSNIPALKLRPFAQKEDLSSNVSNIPALKLRPVAQKEDLSTNLTNIQPPVILVLDPETREPKAVSALDTTVFIGAASFVEELSSRPKCIYLPEYRPYFSPDSDIED